MASAARPATNAVKAFTSIPGIFNVCHFDYHLSIDDDDCRAASLAPCWLLSSGAFLKLNWILKVFGPRLDFKSVWAPVGF